MSKREAASQRKHLGKQGESQAAEFLRNKGYHILEQNYRWARGEIDLIARDGETLVFIEVKTKRGYDDFGPPETWVDLRKQHQIGQVAAHYLQEKQIQDTDCRFDVVAVTFEKGRWFIKHIENAFWL
ncbi:MAG: YraN family protein [candidate division KSB1 bacterium]|nr:YraN family protein [candidate division KSB1 bacterium]